MRFVDIDNSYCCIDNSNCGYRQCDLSILTIGIADINNFNCGYRQCDLSISTIRIAGIWTILIMEIGYAICHYRQFVLLQTIQIVDIDNLICRYRQFVLLM